MPVRYKPGALVRKAPAGREVVRAQPDERSRAAPAAAFPVAEELAVQVRAGQLAARRPVQQVAGWRQALQPRVAWTLARARAWPLPARSRCAGGRLVATASLPPVPARVKMLPAERMVIRWEPPAGCRPARRGGRLGYPRQRQQARLAAAGRHSRSHRVSFCEAHSACKRNIRLRLI
jgi:hypothetical protein